MEEGYIMYVEDGIRMIRLLIIIPTEEHEIMFKRLHPKAQIIKTGKITDVLYEHFDNIMKEG